MNDIPKLCALNADKAFKVVMPSNGTKNQKIFHHLQLSQDKKNKKESIYFV